MWIKNDSIALRVSRGEKGGRRECGADAKERDFRKAGGPDDGQRSDGESRGRHRVVGCKPGKRLNSAVRFLLIVSACGRPHERLVTFDVRPS